MATRWLREPIRATFVVLALVGFLAFSSTSERSGSKLAAAPPPTSPLLRGRSAAARTGVLADAQRAGQVGSPDVGSRDFDRALRQQADTDRTWRQASQGFMQMDKIQYRSRHGDLNVPAFVFQPLNPAEPRTLPALVWVHEDIRGHLYEHFVPFIREAVAQGFVVIAPEYRGSIGYGQAFYDAIDYGGAEVDDVVTAVSVLRTKYPAVDPARIGIIGWSHGGLIALLAVFRNPTSFKAAAAIVPVTNLFQRFAWKGEDRLRAQIDPQNRFGGLPVDRRSIYRERSPLFHVDELQIPLLVHIVRNDDDVNIEEAMPLVDALRARKPALAETKVYEDPPGGHLFDRRVDPRTLRPENTPDQVDSWSRVWRFFGEQLGGH